MRLYWVRHGQMEIRASQVRDLSTVNSLFNQETEGALSPRGRREAVAVARHFAKRPVHAVYSSPLIRARETGDVTAETLGLANNILDGIGELRTGRLAEDSTAGKILSGISNAPLLPDLIKKYMIGGALIPLYFQSWRAGRTEGGESVEEFEQRLGAAFDQLRGNHGHDESVALFAHGYLIFYLCAALATPALARFAAWRAPYIPNGSITEMELAESGPPRLVRFAQTKHL